MSKLREVSQFKLTASVLRHNVARKVRLDLTRTESIDWVLVEISDLSHQISALLYQFALCLRIELTVQLAMKLLKLDYLLLLD